MRVPPTPLLILLALCLLSDAYIYRCLKLQFTARIWRIVYTVVTVLLYCLIGLALMLPRSECDNSTLLCIMWMLYVFSTVYIAKFIFVIVDIVGQLPRLYGRRQTKTVGYVATTCAIVVFLAMWWGALFNRFNIDVKNVDFVSTELPNEFDGYKIVQISDLHVGTFGSDTTFLSRLVDSINAQHPDLIVFTGDIVNSRSEELKPHTSTLGRLSAPDGVMSIMGNHDYGDYSNWPTLRDKEANLAYLRQMQADMGWKMLNNSTSLIHRGRDSIAIVGVENIGDPPFRVYGSLTKAYPHLSDQVFKILLSHNPAHWADSIRNNQAINIALTLSGHTHAMQCEIAGLSPGWLRYEQWGGMYGDDDESHNLYVNIGAGTVGFPARIGATPEITVITLRKR